MLSRKRIIAGTNAHKEPQLTTSGRIKAVASFVQQRIWLHEQLYFHSSDLSVYNILTPLIIKQGSLSIERIRSILLTLIEQHSVLRTAVRFNPQSNEIEQYIQAATDDIYSFKHSRGISTLDQLDRLLTNESIGKHFDIESGRVVRCHIIQRSNDEYDHRLSEGDLVTITFHHISFDNSSLKPFIEAFKKACWSDRRQQPVLLTPQYIDFTLYEQTMLDDTRIDSKMNKARQFWSNVMDGYDWNRVRQLVPDKTDIQQIRSGRGFSTTFSINQHVVDAMMLYASLNNSTMFALSLACYYAFLFKLMNDDDLCVAGNIANRFVQETKDMIGMFVNLAPYRTKIEPNKPFDHLLKKVQQLSSNILEHGCLPYQHIINSYDQRGHQVLPSTLFHYESLMSSVSQSNKAEATTDEGSVLGIYFDRDRSHGNGTALFDLSFTIAHDHQSRSTECFLDCSADIFQNQADVDLLANRFRHMLAQLFGFSMTDEPMYKQSDMSISKLSLILPEEIEEMQRVIFRRLPTIANEVIPSSKDYYGSFTVTAPASYAQTRIWLDERIRFNSGKSQITAYNMPFVYRLFTNCTLSVQQLYNALQLVLAKHQSLHTSLIFDTEKNLLMQRVNELNDNNNRLYTLIESTYETDEQLNDIMHDERQNTQYFDLSQGLVFRYHLVYYKEISSNNLLSDRDVIIFNFHHVVFDISSINIFLNDLNQAYTTSQVSNNDNTTLRYLDYAFIEQQMSMTGASMFWLDALHNCHLDQSLSLPFDRYRLSNEHRTSHTTSISFDFDQDLSHHFHTHASSDSISLEHLTFAIYFIFLFKLTNGQTDLCIAMNINNNRSRDELKSIIGLFENVIPLRCQLDPHWYFHQLLEHVHQITTNSMKYSYFPLQRILNQHPHISKHAFLDTSLEFISYKNSNPVVIGNSQLVPTSFSFDINEDEILNVSDFSLSIYHDMNMNQLSCTINASLDLFNVETIDNISQRFHFILHQLSASIIDNEISKPIYEISLTLPNERLLMQSLNNTQISFSSPLTCIHHEFVYQVMKHPQKLAVELDEQSLTYCELLHYVQVIGIMAIEMSGGVYCPLSPRDPQHRLHALTQQTQSRLVLVHHLTKTKFDDDIISLDIDTILNINVMDKEDLSSVIVKGEEIAYIIFTSGSTGTPKAVQVRHKNFIHCMHCLAYINSFNTDDTVVQMTPCSFDVHVQEILGTLLVGGTLIMLHPGGTIDYDYLSKVLQNKQITYLHSVPSLLHIFLTFIQQNKNMNAVKYLRSLCSGGETFSVHLTGLILKIGITNCIVWNTYGPAEATIDCAVHCINITNAIHNIRIGRPLSNYRCTLMSHYLQSCVTDEEGELCVGGAGVFAGYLGRDDLTAKALVEIDGQLFYRTGDLVRMDNNGLLDYLGRKDHQIKLHGQRIELGEIERCILEIPSISTCVVMKWNDDYLVAYVQSADIDEKVLRQHCQSHLPPHMIPSLFVILDKLPLNANGKVDRKLLPPPDFSSTHLTNHNELLLPMNENEIAIHHIWCDLLKQKKISTNTNIFSIGGHSLIIMQLFHRYKIQFHLQPNILSITDLFQHPTITDHAQLIYQTTNVTHNINDYHWSSLHIMKAKASFAQERIFLDEQIRFSSTDDNTNIYVIPLIYRVSSMNGHISISRLQHAFQSIIRKHQILRTALSLDTNGTIIQHYLDANVIINDKKSSRFSMLSFPNEEREQNQNVKKILNQSDLFDLSQGHVINCHILRRDQSNHSFTQNNDDLLTTDDLILFTVHHIAFDGASTSIFNRDLSLAYQSNDLLPIDDNLLQYIDYSIHEHIMDMTLSQQFWQLELKDYNLARQLSLPIDRQRSSTNQQRSGLASIAEINFDNELCTSFLNYASSHQLTLFQLGLCIFYVFLFKLTHGEADLCISSINANRYRSELVNMIGMFVSTLPYRVELDPHWFFDEAVKNVREKCLSILEHSHYPLQNILSDLHASQSNVSFLEIMFNLITITKDNNDFCLNGVNLEQVSLKESYEIAKFDFSLNFIYNSSSDDNHLSCSFICSRDLFDERTIITLTQRFKYLFEQIFSSTSIEKPVDTCATAISRLDLILSNEMNEMQDVVFCRQINVKNRVSSYPDKLGLDDQFGSCKH
ncbi:unnamed protein product [Adineta steineri]|uniref:Carrier domain-containing protein n=1 Tax=Adineta steineri TaxID=433720 RepID=A0A815MAR4_9BILA|nr:unnamed protein product [Adineta steineri]CAF1420386.1 unnamed protein product [Adineta steineri]